MDLCFATNNPYKVKEINDLIGDKHSIHTMEELGFFDDIEEYGSTLSENSQIKARFIFHKTGIPVIADDSGLEVEALNGAPGVYSARYAGENKNDAANNLLLLENLKGNPNRTARFRTVITLITSEIEKQFEGIVEGRIIEQPKGTSGFGYDPLFIPNGFGSTFAEMNLAEKNKISHRANAFKKLADYLNG